MRPDDRRHRHRWALALAALGTMASLGADPVPVPAPSPASRRVVAPITPEVPGPVVVALQGGKYAEAAPALDGLIAGAKDPAAKSYYRLLRGVAGRLGGDPDGARRALAAALAEEPRGPWAAKVRSELAAVELAAGKPAAAEALARVEAQTLLGPDRKDRLAGVYHAFARRLLAPDDPLTAPDPAAAHALLARARELARGEALRASLLFAMARAAQAPEARGKPINPIQDFRAYLDEYPKGADRDLARFHLGEALLAAGQPGPARLAFADLARDLAGPGPVEPIGLPSKDRAGLRARALYQVAKTHGIPAPVDDAQLNLGVAALRRYLAAAPGDPGAPRAAFEIGASYLHRGQADAAIEALQAFLKGEGSRVEPDRARSDLAGLAMTATFEVARALQGQGKFDPAIAAYRGYLAKFPDGPQSADAQRAILDAQLQAAAEALAREKFAEARAGWQAFVAGNPLDARVPAILFEAGGSFESEKKFAEALAAWETLIGKFPGTEPAGHAQFAVASIFESEKGDLSGAIERFRKVAVEPWKAQADQRVAAMEAKALTVVSPRAFRSGETAHLKVTTRNLETLTFTAYKLNAEAYFRKKRVLGGVESLDVGLVAPDAEWTVPVPGFGRFKPIEANYDLKVAVPGVYVVKVSDEKTLQATAMVVGSDLEAIVKVSHEQILVFAQDMKTGKGRKGARVLVADGSGVILEKVAGDDGVLLAGWDKPLAGPTANASLQYLILDGPDAAGSALAVPEKVAQGIAPRAYIYTDRPAYRPGQEVAIRGVVREAKDGQYSNPAGALYKLEVRDARGRTILSRPTTLSAFGTFHQALRLDPGAPVGAYQVSLSEPGRPAFGGQFEVRSYRLEKLDLEFDLPRAVYTRGETVKADLIAKYQYGAPASGRPIEVTLPDGRTLRGATDEAGKFHVEFPTDGFAEEQALRIVARLPVDNVAAVAGVILATQGFRIGLATPRTVYLDGETFALDATTLDAQGKPSGQELRILVLKQVTQGGRTTERESARHVLTTDKETGKATLSLKVEDGEGGSYILRAAGTDRAGNPVVADRALEVSGKDDATRLRILTDRQSFKVGESAAVNLHSRSKAGTALLAWEADRILQYRLVPIAEGDNRLTWEVDGPQFPNFTLTAARMAGDKFDRAALDIRVERDLRVTVQPTKPAVGPGEDVEVEVTTVDQLGRPVAAEVGLALVDRSLLRQFADPLPAIGRFFYDQTRTGAFATEATNTFRDEPATTPVSEAVVEEAERLAAQTRNDVSRGAVRLEAGLLSASSETLKRRHGDASEPFSNRSYADIPNRPAPVGGGGLGMPGPAGQPAPASPDPAAAPRGAEDLNSSLQYSFTARSLRDVKDADGRLFDGPADATNDDFDQNQLDLGFSTAAKRKANRAAPLGGFEPTPLGKSGRVEQAASPRERFAETAYWNPSVVTGKDGKAAVRFKAPAALSEYRFSARGVTGGDSLVGQGTATLSIRKDFSVDLRLPATLTQGDKPRFVAQVHHVGVKGPAEMSLTIYSGDRQQVFPRKLDLKADGVEEILFEPFEVPDGESVRLTLTAKAGDASDELVAEVPIRPWGVLATASASGTSSDDVTVFVGLPPGRAYEDPDLRIDVSPTLRRLLIELALGREMRPLTRNDLLCRPIPTDTTADRASDLLAATSALAYLREVKAPGAPEAARLADRIRGLAAELVTAQLDDGGWPWVARREGRKAIASDRMASAQAASALAEARSLGLLPEPAALDKAATYLTAEFNRSGGDLEARAAILHALATLGKASFEQANALNRVRQSLPDVALAYLALTLARLDRATLADEVLGVLGPRAKSEPVGPGRKPRTYWEGKGQGPYHRGAVETTALAALAFARVRPQGPESGSASEWLLAHRSGEGWAPHKAKGAALAALAARFGKAGSAEDRYRLVVTVNDAEVHRAEVAGSPEGAAILVPRKVLKVGDPNRIRFHIEGRGTFGYAATMTGFARDLAPEQKRDGKPFLIHDRAYLPADPELDGKPLPTGFAAAINPTTFVNKVTQVARGGRARVRIHADKPDQAARPTWDREFLVVEETLPAGSTLIEGSVRTTASSFDLADGVLTLYFAPDDGLGRIEYDVAGYLPGTYRSPPARIRAAYDPGRVHLGEAGSLQVLAPGEPATDPYRATPDELYARGKALYQGGRLAEAAGPLEELFAGYGLKDEVAKDAARMLLTVHIKDYQPRKVVQDFEILREKGPELVIPFEEILAVGRAYRDIAEPERAYLVFRAIAEASTIEDARVGEALRQSGKTLESVAYLIDLWRESPNTATIESDFFGLSQALASAAGRAGTDPALRRELAGAGVTRSELLLQSIRMIGAFLSQSPRNPLADEASLALLGSYLELEDFESVVKLAPRFAGLYPKSNFLDSFQYSEALGRFSLGQYDRAIEVAEAIARATYKDPNGVDQPSPNKWQAIYILGQIYDARRNPARAVDYYKQVADRFADAAGAVKALTRKELKLPEVAVIRPAGVAAGAPGRPRPAVPDRVELGFRNVAEADLKVYPVDLMRLYLTRRNLAGIAGIDLAGITPLHQSTVKLGDGSDFADKIKTLDLPLTKEGAYLVMARGGELYASGVVLVTPLELEVLEEADSGRVRVTVRDAATGDLMPKVQVKVIGGNNPAFFTGQTDLRGVFVAEGVNGPVTAVARKGAGQYAFYRGTAPVGAGSTITSFNGATKTEAGQPGAQAPAGGAKPDASQALDKNLREQNTNNQIRQLDRLQDRYKAIPAPSGVNPF